ncbi:uncharacterized protein LOC117584400 [Drosophila guanche]|uniref:Uncharacterized protein n=1 Tax=Drosophila guanche TaxID=7266 RepID=A0A3B0K963_DROGU|nr:uncharacterized protein LOC117584400 [Drosophila guanche]SPP82166.1 Hypothetical predicted protein [Drosophila guanche]
MGNVMDRKVSPTPTPTPIDAKPREPEKVEEKKDAPKLDTNLALQLFCYRQQLSGKNHHMMKWATSKLLLTEKLLKLQQTYRPLAPRFPWDNYEATMLTQDVDVDVDGDEENRAPNNDDLSRELTTLKNYRMELREIIIKVAQKKKTKNSQKKLKRLTRRTLISSKKPSNKAHRKPQYNEWLLGEDEPECPLQADSLQPSAQVDSDQSYVHPDVITID